MSISILALDIVNTIKWTLKNMIRWRQCVKLSLPLNTEGPICQSESPCFWFLWKSRLINWDPRSIQTRNFDLNYCTKSEWLILTTYSVSYRERSSLTHLHRRYNMTSRSISYPFLSFDTISSLLLFLFVFKICIHYFRAHGIYVLDRLIIP